jgi:dihydroflavonol-4-reductase
MKKENEKASRVTTLVTGGTGFLGAHLVRLLASQTQNQNKARLRVLVQSAPPAWLKDREREIEIVSGSVTSPDDVARAVAGVDQIYHLAGMVSHRSEDAHRMYAVHVDGTRLVCEAAARAGVTRIVMASTSGTVAVSRRADDVADEETPAPVDIISRWAYYASKLYQEEAARRACGDKVELVIVNPSLLLGPGDDRLSSTRPIVQFLAREILLVPAGGLSIVDARDVASVLPIVMARGTPGARYLLGAVNWTFAEFFGRLERLTKIAGPKLKFAGEFPHLAARAQAAVYKKLGRKVAVDPESVDMAQYYWYLDAGKAARDLGFIPRDPADTLRDTVDYIRAHVLGRGAFSKAV